VIKAYDDNLYAVRLAR